MQPTPQRPIEILEPPRIGIGRQPAAAEDSPPQSEDVQQIGAHPQRSAGSFGSKSVVAVSLTVACAVLLVAYLTHQAVVTYSSMIESIGPIFARLFLVSLLAACALLAGVALRAVFRYQRLRKVEQFRSQAKALEHDQESTWSDEKLFKWIESYAAYRQTDDIELDKWRADLRDQLKEHRDPKLGAGCT